MKNKYKVIYYYSEEDNSYLVFAPELPGCFSDGKTLVEALSNLDSIIEDWIDTAKEENRDIPLPISGTYKTTNPTIFDVAECILSKTGSISSMVLEKLSYYCLVWSLVWFDKPIFQNKFQAWVDGPVCNDLFQKHKKKRVVSANSLNSNHVFNEFEKLIMDSVISIYGKENGEFLSSLTHNEKPWRLTRGNIPDNARSTKIITNDLIKESYSY